MPAVFIFIAFYCDYVTNILFAYFCIIIGTILFLTKHRKVTEE